MSTLTLLFNIVLEILAIEIRLESKITDINIGKEADVGNPREPLKLSDLVRDLSKMNE